MTFCAALTLFAAIAPQTTTIKVSDPNIAYSPYNWFVSGSDYAQTPNPGAYFKLRFTGPSVSLKLDVSTFTKAKVPADQYPMVRYSVDEGSATTLQLTPTTTNIDCGKGLKAGYHSLLFQYVAGYVFLDFWTPINAIRLTSIELAEGEKTIYSGQPFRRALFLGDSITNGDDNIATFAGGITNAVDTQDATIGYPAVVAAATKSEYGIVAYGGASWDRNAADGQTPGLTTFWNMFDKDHSRLIKDSSKKHLPINLYAGEFSPMPDDVYVNMGENRTPNPEDVAKVLDSIRKACNPETNIFVIVPFSGRARSELQRGVGLAFESSRFQGRTYLLDIGISPYLPVGRPTMHSVDGQHPLAFLHAQLGAQIVAERARLLAGKSN